MTPDEHRDRAEALAIGADSFFEDLQAGPPTNRIVPNSDWRALTAMIRLAELHLALSQHPSRHVPTNEVVDYPDDSRND